MKIALFGYGYWGPNLLRNLLSLPNVKEVQVADKDRKRLNLLNQKHLKIKTTVYPEDLIKDPAIDAVVIATPVNSHFEYAIKALKEGKHVLVEKPMTVSAKQAEILLDTAEKKNLVLMVDHTFLYNGAVRKMKQILENESFGSIIYLDSKRINLGIYHSDISVVWDLASHDLSIINYFFDETPENLRCIGKVHNTYNTADLAHMFITYSSGVMVHVNSSWASPVKIRQMIVGGENKMLIYDDIEPTDKLKIYDYRHKKDNKRSALIDFRLGDIKIPKFSLREPLNLMLETFISSVSKRSEGILSPEEEILIIKTLEMADRSMNKGGRLERF